MNGQTKAAFIWDLDGTLLDSYGEIVSSLRTALQQAGIMTDEKEVLNYVIRHSVKEYLEDLVNAPDFSGAFTYDEINEKVLAIHDRRIDDVYAAPNAKKILEFLHERGDYNFVFTHRGKSTIPVLKNLEFLSYMDEILSIEDGFARKPSPDAVNYLQQKYHLDRQHTYFVGDRRKDMECGKNADIKCILYLPANSVGMKTGLEDYVISDFEELKNMIDFL